jgi:hypothetical protein
VEHIGHAGRLLFSLIQRLELAAWLCKKGSPKACRPG